MPNGSCFICGTAIEGITPDGDAQIYSCRRCGLLRVTGTAAAVSVELRENATAAKIDAVSHIARRWSRPNGNSLNVSAENLGHWFQEAQLATPTEQARNLLIWLGTHPEAVIDPASQIEASIPEMASIVGGRAHVASMDYLVKNCASEDWLEIAPTSAFKDSDFYDLRLTFHGWERFAELLRQDVASKTAFMAMAFSDDRLNQVYTECFVPAVADAGFTLRRLDENQGAGLIDDQLRVAIRTAKFLVVDLTTGNRGAYWEAGFAEGLGKSVIYVCDEAIFNHDDYFKRPHFDTNHLVTVTWSSDALEDACKKLTATIRNTFPTEATMS